MALFSPEAHEQLTAEPWSANRARAAIADIVACTLSERRADGVWTAHPLDEPETAGRAYAGVYLGAAGVLWALARLGAEGDWAAFADTLDDRYVREPDYGPPAPGFWLGAGAGSWPSRRRSRRTRAGATRCTRSSRGTSATPASR